MSLRIEILSDLAAAERRLSEIVQARPSPLARLNVLYGSALQRVDAQRRMAVEMGGGLTAVYGFTPVDLAQAAVSRGRAEPRQSWPRGADLAAVRALLDRLQLNSFDSEAPGLAQALLRTLTDLREGALEPEELPVGDLRAAYTSWRDVVRQVGDRTAIYEDAVSAATNAAAYRDALGGAPLIVSGISDLTRIQRLLLRRCAEAVDVRVLLVDPPGAEVHPSIPMRSADLLAADTNGQIIRGASPAASPTEAQFFSTSDPVAEAEEIARRILDLAREGVPFHRVAVLHQQGPATDERIAATLDRAGVPVWRIAGEPVTRSAAGRATRELLRLLLSDADQVDQVELIDALARPGLADRLWIGDEEVARRPQQWERVAEAAGQVRGWQPTQARIAHWAEANPSQSNAVTGLLTVVDDLRGRSEQLRQAQSWTLAVTLLADSLDTYLALSPVADAEPGQSFRQVTIETVERLRDLDDHGLAYDPAVALSATLRALDGTVVRDRRRLIGGVNIGPANGPARGIRYDAIFVAGCAERVFPAPGRQDPLLPDEARSRINARVPAALALQSERAASDRHVFRLLRQAARRRFTVSWTRRSSAIGGPSRASSLLLETASELASENSRPVAFQSEEELAERGHLLRITSSASAVTPTKKQVERGDWSSVIRALDQSELQTALLTAPGVRRESLLPLLWPSAESAIRATQERNQPRFTEFDGQVTLPAGWDSLERTWSALALETYVRCPYQFFLKDVLGVESVVEPLESGGETVQGQLVLRILRHWLSQWLALTTDNPGSAWAEYVADQQQLLALADPILSQAQSQSLLGFDAASEQITEQLKRDLDHVRRAELADAREGWTPVAVDRPYDNATVGIGGGRSLRWHGQLQRLDTHSDGRLRAVRYTFGTMEPGIEGFRNGSVLRPIADLSALAPELRNRDLGIDAAEVVLRSVTPSGDFASQTLRGNDFTSRGGVSAPSNADDLIATLGAITGGIEAGSFIANVGEPSTRRPNCQSCPFEAACTPDVGRRSEFKANHEPERIRALASLRRKRVEL